MLTRAGPTHGTGSSPGPAEAADLALVAQAGPELAVPATKTYTAQLAALAELTAALAPEDPGFDAAFAAACTAVPPGPDLPAALAPMALVEALARNLGLDPDRPRGLTKVTQTGGSAA
jgi:fructoselysine-6-P-deglycase FrlB-like protein